MEDKDEGMNTAREVLQKKVRQMFSQESPESVMEILNLYGTEERERETERVQLAILKLSDGSLEKLLHYVKTAKQDYRDVLAYAEYPDEMSAGFTEMSSMPPQQAKAIRKKDVTQYAEWLQDDS